MQTWPPKQPAEILDYQVDWSDVLEEGETIATSTFLITGGSVEEDSSSDIDGLTTVWLSGGEVGDTCTITNRITTSEGRTYDENIRLRIRGVV